MFGGDGNMNGHQDGNGSSATVSPMGGTAGAVMPQQNPPVSQPAQPAPPPAVTPPANDSTAGNYIMDDEPSSAPAVVTPTTAANVDDLLDIKRNALQQLSPLLSHLDQSPEEKFRTTMMMIQASDDDSLIQQAYQAALAIQDEKARAQALLDVVNEINYFTQNHADASS